jgi:hypothetical protein
VNIDQAWDEFYFWSGKASDISRQLAFAGIALIWIFKTGPTSLELPPQLVLAAAALILCLFFDLLQYLANVIIWAFYVPLREREFRVAGKPHTDDFEHSKWISAPGWLFFCLKMLALGVGQYTLFVFLVTQYHLAQLAVIPA